MKQTFKQFPYIDQADTEFEKIEKKFGMDGYKAVRTALSKLIYQRTESKEHGASTKELRAQAAAEIDEVVEHFTAVLKAHLIDLSIRHAKAEAANAEEGLDEIKRVVPELLKLKDTAELKQHLLRYLDDEKEEA